MLKTEDLTRLVALLDEGRAVVENVGRNGADRESARVRLSQLLGDAIRVCDGGSVNGGRRPIANGSPSQSWSVIASRSVRPAQPAAENGHPRPSEGRQQRPEPRAPAG